MNPRGKHFEIDVFDVFGDEELPRQPGKLWPEDEDYAGKLGHPRHDAASLIRFANQTARAKSDAKRRAAKAAANPPSTSPNVPDDGSPFTPSPEHWRLPDTHPAAGTTYGLGRVRRVTVKARYRLNGARGDGPGRGQPLHKHVVYLARPEAQRKPENDRERQTAKQPTDAPVNVFFDATNDAIDVSDRPQAWRSDRHHWRLIVSPEDAIDLDLRDFGRAFARRLEAHLNTRLEWFGVVHVNTEHPHVHLIVRGIRRDGKGHRDLTMTPATVSHGLRELAEIELTNRLGLHDEKAADARLTAVAAERKLTPLDDLLARIARSDGKTEDTDRPFRLPTSWVPEACGLHHLQRRLTTLEQLALATRELRSHTAWGRVEWWTLKANWQQQLALRAVVHQGAVTSLSPQKRSTKQARTNRGGASSDLARRITDRDGAEL